MRIPLRRETFIALRARREAHQVANEIVNPPMERPIPEVRPTGPDEEYLANIRLAGVREATWTSYSIPYPAKFCVEAKKAGQEFKPNWIFVTRALVHIALCIAALFLFLWLAASISAVGTGVKP